MEWGPHPVGVDRALRTLVCGTELTSSDFPQRLSAASPCLSCQDECQELEGRSLGRLLIPALLFPRLSQQTQGLSCLPGGLCSVLS